MYKCVIIDDEKLARQLIEGHLSKFDNFEVLASCKSAIEASKLLSEHAVDLLFLDIEMPVLKGTEFYKNLISKPKVIFTTAYRDYAIDGFELNAIDYLLKPITFARFLKSIEKFLATEIDHKKSIAESNSSFNKNYIFVTEDRKQVKIILDNILFIESVKNYIKIKTKDKTHLVKHGISSFENLLDDRFLRIHRSFIVNMNKITAYSKHDIEIDKTEIPIGESYKGTIDKIK